MGKTGEGGGRSVLKIVGPHRASVCLLALPRAAPLGSPATHLPPVGLGALSGLGSLPGLVAGDQRGQGALRRKRSRRWKRGHASARTGLKNRAASALSLLPWHGWGQAGRLSAAAEGQGSGQACLQSSSCEKRGKDLC